MSAPITATGIKGFLLWFAREQPALYAKIAPQLPKVAPKAFGNYLQDRRKLRAIYRSGVVRRAGVGISGFGDYYTLPEISVSAPAYTSTPVTVNYSAQLAPVSYTSSVTPLSTSVDTGTLSPVAIAANSGTASTSVANAIGQTVAAAASIYMTNQNAALQQSVVQSQLARAAAGLPPLNTSLAQLGIPQATTGGTLSTGGMLLLGGAALLALLLSSGKSSS